MSIEDKKDAQTEECQNSLLKQEASRREFLKKYGKLAAITPVAMTMTLHSKQALASCTDCGPDSGDFGPL